MVAVPSWTLKAGRTAGGEPDECSIVGADQSKDRPDLVMEVASLNPLTGPLEKIRSSGLYVYDSDAPLPTLEAWGYVS